MGDRVRCKCQSCTIRSLTGPVVVITLGVLFLLHQVHGGHFEFENTWPVILVVIGLLQLASAFAPQDGHIGTQTNLAVPGVPPPPPVDPPPPVPPLERQ
jgi:hypothetical protein